MNITKLTGANAYRNRMAAKAPKIAKQSGKASGVSARDRVELTYDDVLKAEHEGCIEVNGRRFAVSGDMAPQMRRAYEEMRSRNEAKAARQAAEANARAARQQAEAAKNDAKAMKQAMEIARRIAKGGQVPPQDEEFLMHFSQEMYMSAKMMALMAKEHEKHDSVLEDEEETAETGEIEAVDDTRAAAVVTVSGDEVSGASVGEVSAVPAAE